MSLIAHYPLNGDATDYFGNDGTPTNVSWVDGKSGQAAEFNGSSSKIDCYVEKARNNVNVSISCWIKPNTLESMAFITQQRSDGLQHSRGLLMGDASGEITAFSRNSAYSWNALKSGVNAVVGVYSHVCLTQYLDRISLFVDGELRASMDMGSYVDSYNDFFAIGKYTNSSSFFFDGQIDDVRIYDHALSQKEVSEIAKGLVASYNFDGDIINIFGSDSESVYNASFVDTAKGKAASFNGTSDYIRKNENLYLGTNHRTVFCWIMKTSAGDNYNCAMHRGNGPSVDNSDIYLGVTAANKLIASLGESNWPAAETNITCVNDVWYFLAVTWDGSLGSVYVNGVLENTYALTSFPSRDTFPLRFGASNDGLQYQFGGLVTGAKIHTTALSSEQIYKEYITGLSVDNIGNIHASSYTETIEDNFDGTSLSDNWIPFGEQFGDISMANGECTIKNLSGGVNDQIGIYSKATIPVGGRVTVVSKNPQGRHSSVIAVGTAPFVPYPHGGAITSGPSFSWYSRADAVTSNISGRDSNGVTFYASAPNANDLRSYSEFQIHRETENSIALYKDGVLVLRKTDFYFTGNHHVYFSTDGHTRPSVITIDSVRIENLSLSVHRGGINSAMSEVGVSRGLVSWLPLIGDTKDRVTNEVATNNGATPVGDGYEFNSTDHISTGRAIFPESSEVWEGASASCWIKSTDFSAEGWVISQYDGSTQRFIWNTTTSGVMRYFIGGATVYGNTALTLGEWYHVGFTRSLQGDISLYLNGQLDATGVVTAWYAPTFTLLGNSGGGSGSTFTLHGPRIYNRALTPEEVAQEYNSGKAFLTKNTAFAKEFIEV